MLSIQPPPWGPPAAYFYTLKLDDVSLAWEYLRRNARYCRDFSCAVPNLESGQGPHRWGLRHWEDPRIDARSVDPHWLSTSSEIRLDPDREVDSTIAFNFWKIPGQKTLWHCRDQLRLTSRRGNEVLHRVQWTEDLGEGDPCRVSLAAGPGFATRARVAHGFLRCLGRDLHNPFPDENLRPSLRALTHMQILQALDGEGAGASQREIAWRLFGLSSDFNWEADSRWRTRIRYLLKCGRARTSSGYRVMTSGGTHTKPKESR